MYEINKQICLPNATHLHIIQMNRWNKPKKPAMQPLDYWIYFFMRANKWQQLPQDAFIPEIEEAMTVLEDFADDPEKYEYYRARYNIQLAEQSIESENRRIREDYQQALESRDKAFDSRDKALESRDQAFESRDKAFKLVQSLLATNTMSAEQIAEITGLPIEQINRIANN